MEVKHTATQLDDVFSMLCDEDDWRLPVCRIVPGDSDRELISEAVWFFTGSKAEFKDQPDGRVLVTADGYFLEGVIS